VEGHPLNAEFDLLMVQTIGDTLIAKLPIARVVGNELAARLDQDFQRLVTRCRSAVILDLRAVQSFDGSLFPRLLRLKKNLEESSTPLTACVEGSLREVVKIIRQEQILEVVSEIKDIDG